MRVRDVGVRQRGSVLPLIALVVVMVGMCGMVLGRLGANAVEAGRARTAADAAALAGAAEGVGAARALARANGGELVSFEEDGGAFVARVEVGEAVASARAVGEPDPGAGASAGTIGLVPALSAALARAGALLGEGVPVTSGWRSSARQEALWRARASNPYPVARPGTSAHEQGRAVDVPAAFAPRLASVAPAVGLCWPLPRTDPVHFELCGPIRGS